MDFFNRAFETVSNFFQALSPGRKMAFVGMGLGLIVSIAGLFIWAGQATYAPLIQNMTPEDSTSVIRYLRDKRIPFTVDEATRSVSVPPEKVYDLRLELASSGLAQSGVVGYEVFDKQSFGATSTIQRINEQRAKEGELVRTIDHIKGVERSRVHLAIPQKSAFLEKEEKSTASVILDLAPAFNLTEDQTRGIQRMVAAAVQGMDVNNVTIISNTGKLLSQNSDDPAAAFAAANMEYQRKFEHKLEDKVASLLSTVVGEGKVKTEINADFDFSRIAENQVIYDNENTAVRSTEKDVDNMQGSRPLPAGAPGVRANIPNADNQTVQSPIASNSTNRNRESINYDVPRTQRNIEKPMASLKRLSVAVMVDTVPVADANVAGGIRQEPVSAAKLEEFRAMVANAVGWDKDRDPPIEVKSISFFKEDLDAATKASEAAERQRMIEGVAKWGAIGLLFTLFFLFVVRPFIKWVTENTVDSVEDFLPQTLEELEKVQSKQVAQSLEDILPEIEEKVDPEKVQSEMLKEKVNALVNDNPHKASQILHEWIAEKPKDSKEKSA